MSKAYRKWKADRKSYGLPYSFTEYQINRRIEEHIRREDKRESRNIRSQHHRINPEDFWDITITMSKTEIRWLNRPYRRKR